MDLISIIVPVYNVEKYLERCLESLVNQSYQKIEIIIVDDESPDTSSKIIAKYEKKYPKIIKAFSKKNGGLSSARNYGLKKSHGKYVAFVDSDDYVEKDYILKMYQAIIHNKADIAICGIYDEHENRNVTNVYESYIPKKTCSIFEDKQQLLNRIAAWNKLYKKELFDDLEFCPNKIYEDLRLIPKLYLKANKICYVDTPLYHYVIRDGSIMTSSNIKKNYDLLEAFDDLIAYFKNHDLLTTFNDELEFLAVDNILISCSYRLVKITKFLKLKKVITPFKEYVELNFPHYLNNKYLETLSSNRTLVLKLVNQKKYKTLKLLSKLKR